MNTVSSQELQRDPLTVLNRVEAGEFVVVIRDGHAVAEMRPVKPGALGPRPYGLCEGEFVVPDDFDAPLPDEILREFAG